MRVAGLLPGRLRRRTAAPREASRLLLPAPVAELRVLPGPGAVPAARSGEHPYPAVTAPGITAARLTVRRIADGHRQAPPRPAFYPAAPAPETAPQPVIPDGTLGMNEVLDLRRLIDGIKGIDGKALDAARAQQGLTYARTIGAPFHNALLAGWRSPVRPVHRHGEAATRRAEALAYPSYYRAEIAGLEAYDAVMRHADRITGTRGTGRYRPAITAGDAA